MKLATTTMLFDNSSPDMISRLKAYSKISGVVTFIIGSIVLCGWIFDIPLLKNLYPTFVSMKANAAIAIMLTGVSLLFFHSPRKSPFTAMTGSFCAAFVAAIGLLTFIEYVGGWNFGLDQLFFKEPIGTVGTYVPGRMALNTAFCFFCLGIALLLIRSKAIVPFVLSQLLNIATAIVSLIALIGYIYNISEFYGYAIFTKMALHTAFALFILSTGILCAVPDRGIMIIISGKDFGGFLARRLLPFAFTVPIIIGWLRLEGERHKFFGTVSGVLMVAVIYIILFMVLVWEVARRLNRFDFKRREAEEAFRIGEENFRTIFENNSSAIAIIEPDTTISMVNDAYCQISGYTKQEIIGMSWVKQIPPDDLERLKEYNRRRLINPNDAPDKYEFKFYRKNGEIRHALISIAMMQSGQKMIASFVDITDRKRVEEKNLQLASIIESSEDAIISKTLDGIITSWNSGAEKMYGYSKQEVINQSISIIIPPDHRDDMIQILEKIRVGQHIDNYETVRWKKDGAQIDVSVSISPVHDGEGILIGASTIARDITERKRVEKELRKLSRAVDQSPASIVITDTSGAIEYVNPKFVRVTGYSFEEAIGKNPRILKSGEKPAEEYKQLWDTITSGSEWQGEFHNKKKNGELYWEFAIISPITDAGGIITHFLGVKEDITHRKEAETEREKLVVELKTALTDVKTLSGLIPICASCKKIRDDHGYWQQVESYIQKHSEAKFTHGLCPDCMIKFYPDYSKEKQNALEK